MRVAGTISPLTRSSAPWPRPTATSTIVASVSDALSAIGSTKAACSSRVAVKLRWLRSPYLGADDGVESGLAAGAGLGSGLATAAGLGATISVSPEPSKSATAGEEATKNEPIRTAASTFLTPYARQRRAGLVLCSRECP